MLNWRVIALAASAMMIGACDEIGLNVSGQSDQGEAGQPAKSSSFQPLISLFAGKTWADPISPPKIENSIFLQSVVHADGAAFEEQYRGVFTPDDWAHCWAAGGVLGGEISGDMLHVIDNEPVVVTPAAYQLRTFGKAGVDAEPSHLKYTYHEGDKYAGNAWGTGYQQGIYQALRGLIVKYGHVVSSNDMIDTYGGGRKDAKDALENSSVIYLREGGNLYRYDHWGARDSQFLDDLVKKMGAENTWRLLTFGCVQLG